MRAYLVAGITVVRKYEEQSAVFVGYATARTAFEHLALCQYGMYYGDPMNSKGERNLPRRQSFAEHFVREAVDRAVLANAKSISAIVERILKMANKRLSKN